MKKVEMVDPLYVIFEKFLHDFGGEDLDIFIESIVSEYLSYLKANAVMIPEKRRTSIYQDLCEEVYDMFAKKIHGCSSIREFRSKGGITKLEIVLARDRYYKLTGTE